MKRLLHTIAIAICAAQATATGKATTGSASSGTNLAFRCMPPEIRTIGVVMPASILPKNKFDAGVAALRNAGVKVKLAPRLDFRKVASAEARAADLEEMWMDPEVDLVLCARGGTGTEKVLPLLNWEKLRSRNQRVLGFSNITMLLNAMLKEKAGHPFSGPSVSQMLYATGDTFEWLHAALAGAPLPTTKLHPIKAGAFSGLPCGGHIALVKKGILTHWSCNAADRVVFLERNNSATAKTINSELKQIAASGWLKGCAGIVFGDITPGGELKSGKGSGVRRHLNHAELEAARQEVERSKHEFAASVGCPVYDGYQYGHVPVSHTIDFCRTVSVAEDGTMSWR